MYIVIIVLSEEMNNYALSIDDKTGAKSYIRFNSRPGESVTLSNVRIDSGTMQELKEAVREHSHCESICLSTMVDTSRVVGLHVWITLGMCIC